MFCRLLSGVVCAQVRFLPPALPAESLMASHPYPRVPPGRLVEELFQPAAIHGAPIPLHIQEEHHLQLNRVIKAFCYTWAMFYLRLYLSYLGMLSPRQL